MHKMKKSLVKSFTQGRKLPSPLTGSSISTPIKFILPLFLLGSPEADEVDTESEICSVIIPPLLPPVQSHAILEKSLGHEIPIPRTPARTPKFSTGSSASTSSSTSGSLPPPPPLPTRTSSKLSLQRPRKTTGNGNIGGIYANFSLNRTSLMSTGSSEESSGSSGLQDEILSPSASEVMFSWPNYSVSPSSSQQVNNHPVEAVIEHRSVSQIGEPPDSSAASETSGNSNSSDNNTAYVKMNPGGVRSSEATYMNVIYNAVQRQGGGGSVEDAISPYLEMTSTSTPKQHQKNSVQNNLKMLPNANVDSISAIYARPQIDGCPEDSSSVVTSTKSTTSSTASKSSKKSSTSRKNKSKHQNMSELKQLMQEVTRKRQFRVGLNLFNSRPALGIEFLASKGFLELSSECVGKFLYSTHGLSLEKIGDYLGSIQSPFAMKVLTCFMQEFNFSGQRMDKSLRKLLEHVRVPGEAQKIEKIMEIFGKRYAACNPNFVAKHIKSADSIVTLAFAIMLLNTDLHTPNLKMEKKMSVQDFINNLKGVDAGRDFDQKLLKQIYKGIKKQEFVSGVDHVVQIQALQSNILNDHGKPMNLAEPHLRRLVCLCRLYEVLNINVKKEPSPGSHQRDLFLFNDLLIVTKQNNSSSKSKSNNPIYSSREQIPLKGLEVTLFHTPVYSFGIQISRKSDGVVLVTLNAGSEHDRYKFVMDLQESIFEMDQMDVATQEFAR